MELTRSKRRARVVLKRFMYSQLSLLNGLLIAIGREKPLVRFTVEADPPSVYLNFAIQPEQLAAFEAELGLPLPLSPIACLEGDEPFHCLTLNVYRVSGLSNGIRAEWSTYISDADGIPRYLVVEAQTEQGTMDPVEIVVRPGRVSYTETDGRLAMTVGSDGDTEFTAELARPTDGPKVQASHQWVTANDYIYWRNGVCDRTFYDAGLANPSARGVSPDEVQITNTTPWARFLDPVPRSVVVFDKAIEFAISPWWNIDDLRP